MKPRPRCPGAPAREISETGQRDKPITTLQCTHAHAHVHMHTHTHALHMRSHFFRVSHMRFNSIRVPHGCLPEERFCCSRAPLGGPHRLPHGLCSSVNTQTMHHVCGRGTDTYACGVRVAYVCARLVNSIYTDHIPPRGRQGDAKDSARGISTRQARPAYSICIYVWYMYVHGTCMPHICVVYDYMCITPASPSSPPSPAA